MRVLAVLLLAATPPITAAISDATFRHRFIAREMPGRNMGFGTPALADFDKDGDLDFAVSNRGDGKLYWFEQRSADNWVRHEAGELALGQLGCVTIDADGDGWIDIVIGGYWFRNPGDPRTRPFVRHEYDPAIMREIHDMVVADIDGDGREDIVAMGDADGCFWYSIPPGSATGEWPRTLITFAVRNDLADIHSGLNPNGVADLDGDGDRDVLLTDRWYENTQRGTRWIEHKLLFGKIGPWGFSSRSWIKDLDGDGDADIVVADSDGQNSGLAWIENRDGKMRNHRVHWLANAAPGTRGSFHSLRLADFDLDGDDDIVVVEQEDPSILPQGATPRWFVWENTSVGQDVRFTERVIFDGRLGGHDVIIGDIDGDGDTDIASKIWSVWSGNANGGKVHIDWFENRTR
ncbi:MAG: VCBS repeat-containing protein [Bryobacteraceae bacterium]